MLIPTIITQIKFSIKLINFKLLVVLLFLGIIPTIYKTIRFFFLGDLPNDWGFNIASQIIWLNVIYEVLQEAILLPIFYLIGKSLIKKNEIANKIKTGLIVVCGAYTIISLIVFFFSEQIITFMNQKESLIEATVTYIRIETVASIFYTVFQFLMAVIIAMQRIIFLYSLLLIQMLLTITSDVLLISNLPFSLQLGVNGIAIGNILINISLLFLVIVYIHYQGYTLNFMSKGSYSWMKEWFQVGSYSGLESFVRNAAFLLMVFKMINEVGEQGVFLGCKQLYMGMAFTSCNSVGTTH